MNFKGVIFPERKESETPLVSEKYGWRYHHIGIPTNKKMAGEIYIKKYGMYVSGFSSSPFGIEWMRFDKNSPISDLVKTVPHIAFEVDDLQEAIKGLELIDEISSPAEGIKVAMFQHNGAPVELIEFS